MLHFFFKLSEPPHTQNGLIGINSRWAWQHIPSSRHTDHDDDNNDTQPNGQTGLGKAKAADCKKKISQSKKGTAPANRKQGDCNHQDCQSIKRTEAATIKRAKGPSRSRYSLSGLLESLHLLLRSPYFSLWPLEIRFFSLSVHRVWQTRCKRLTTLIPDSVTVAVDQSLGHDRTEHEIRPLDRIDIKNVTLANYFAKSEFVLEHDETVFCSICQQQMSLQNDLIVLCSHENCNCTSHVMCLSSRFLEAGESSNRVIPAKGECPACGVLVDWPILMKELTRRLRGNGAQT